MEYETKMESPFLRWYGTRLSGYGFYQFPATKASGEAVTAAIIVFLVFIDKVKAGGLN